MAALLPTFSLLRPTYSPKLGLTLLVTRSLPKRTLTLLAIPLVQVHSTICAAWLCLAILLSVDRTLVLAFLVLLSQSMHIHHNPEIARF